MPGTAEQGLDVPSRGRRGIAPGVVIAAKSSLACPSLCACCMQVAAVSVKEKSWHRSELFVQYCEDCHAHLSKGNTKKLATVLASLLLSLTASVTLVFLSPELPVAGYYACVLIAAFLPFFALWPRRALPPHTAVHQAVFWLNDGELYCSNPVWAALVARENAAVVRAVISRPHTFFRRFGLVILVPLALSVFTHRFLWPEVRVVNLTDWELRVVVDGRELTTVEASGFESPSAGNILRLPAGSRKLQALSADGKVVAEAMVDVEPGAKHLYAPAHSGHCFWLEETNYGREHESRSSTRPLPAGDFWMLPEPIDSWFVKNPEPAADPRSTGGSMVALRHAPCVQAPAAARNQ